MKPYTHPSLNIVNSVTVKLIDKNYIFWKWQFEVFLNGQGLLGFVTGSLTFSSTDQIVRSKSGRQSLVSNGASRAVLALSQNISKSIVVHCNTSQEIQLTWPVILTVPHHLAYLSFRNLWWITFERSRTSVTNSLP